MAAIARPRSTEEVAKLLTSAPPRGVIPRGLGRAYGDAAQSAGGLALDCTRLAPNLDINPETGLITASAGISLDALIRDLMPLGWFMPFIPGTRYVTLGGAVAADVHGKSHHADGSFGNFITALTLVTPDGEVQRVTPTEKHELFWATVGGMGLTGVVTRVTFQASPVETSRMRVDTERARNLDHALEIMTSTDDRYRYAAAWIDLLARGSAMGRSVLTRGDHAGYDELPARGRHDPLGYDARIRVSAPPWAPPGLLNRLTVRAFNELWFRKAPAERRGEIQTVPTFFHPLDMIGRWNTLYGPRGLVQYQLVVPFGAEDTLRRTVARLSNAGAASFLAVLKRFGEGNPGHLSFPMSGWTLSLDVPGGVPGLAELLAELDQEVAAAGGRVYLAKDAVLSGDQLQRMYPRLDEWRQIRRRVDPGGTMRSDLARRLEL